jgi:hypothetical protein
MNTETLLAIIENPTVTASARQAAMEKLRELQIGDDDAPSPVTTLEAEDAATNSEFGAPPLKKLFPDRFPDQAQGAYYRARAFLSEIDLGGLAKQLLEDCRVKTMADVEELTLIHRKEYSCHRDAAKLKALWMAAQAALDWEYQVDFAEFTNAALFRMILHTELGDDELADFILGSLQRAKAEYLRIAAEFPASN